MHDVADLGAPWGNGGQWPAAAGSRVSMLLSIAREVDRRRGGGPETWRVGLWADSLARGLGLPASRARRVRLAAQLRDVGVIGVPCELLGDPTTLDEGGCSQIRKHPEIGARMVADAGLADISSWVWCHHEHPNGKGYPRGLVQAEIPLEARILAVIDAYAGMVAERPYRRPVPPERAREELSRQAGTQFDRGVVEAFLALGTPSAASAAAGAFAIADHDPSCGSRIRHTLRDRLVEVSFEPRGEVLVVRLEGEVDGSNARELGSALVARVANSALGLVLDLSGARYLDSSGINLLFDLGARLGRRRQELRIVVQQESPLTKVLQLSGLGSEAPVGDSVDEAVEAIAAGPGPPG